MNYFSEVKFTVITCAYGIVEANTVVLQRQCFHDETCAGLRDIISVVQQSMPDTAKLEISETFNNNIFVLTCLRCRISAAVVLRTPYQLLSKPRPTPPSWQVLTFSIIPISSC